MHQNNFTNWKSEVSNNSQEEKMKNFVSSALFLFCSLSVIYGQTHDEKMTAINFGTVLPYGDFSKINNPGVFVGDITKWYVGSSVAFLGRLEASYFDGKEISYSYSPGYTYSYYSDPASIVAIGSGLELHGTSRINPYLDLDVPSIALTFFGGSRGVLRTGFGAGVGFEFGIAKSTFGVEVKFNSYVVRGYSPLQFGSVGVKAAI